MSQPSQEAQEKELRRQMREGRTPLLQAIRETYAPYLLARKALERKNSEAREQLGLLNNTFSASIKKLRESGRNTDESAEMVLHVYRETSKQASAVAAFIDKQLPGLEKLYEPVAKAFAAYQGALDAYNQFMQEWVDKLPESDTSGRALELVKQEIERSLR